MCAPQRRYCGYCFLFCDFICESKNENVDHTIWLHNDHFHNFVDAIAIKMCACLSLFRLSVSLSLLLCVVAHYYWIIWNIIYQQNCVSTEFFVMATKPLSQSHPKIVCLSISAYECICDILTKCVRAHAHTQHQKCVWTVVIFGGGAVAAFVSSLAVCALLLLSLSSYLFSFKKTRHSCWLLY